ncbi:hypothetical protein [Staphylococcus caprae]|uniref:hypothetical protein n=1 Tax=Staphylococcus caprae TaxID=29380 RepID=UPI001452151D|nr:hypothetical protein [Staphylococcus caprae]QJE26635.1 hypothetical protein HHJ99_12760 [Staphylococcus caprae]QJE26704.1 hypothetical protein HHJ99_13110 [Staphylococcus caprae]
MKKTVVAITFILLLIGVMVTYENSNNAEAYVSEKDAIIGDGAFGDDREIRYKMFDAEKKIKDGKNIDKDIKKINKKISEFNKNTVNFKTKKNVLAGYVSAEEDLRELNDKKSTKNKYQKELMEDMKENLTYSKRELGKSLYDFDFDD